MARPPDVSGARIDALLVDLDTALDDLFALTADEPARWAAARPGKWTAGQHTEHVVVVIEHTGRAFEKALAGLRAGSLPPVPPRGALARLWVALLLRGWMPRGGRTVPAAFPGEHPERERVRARGAAAVAKHRAIAAPLTPTEREQLWIQNMFMPRWHYTLPEMIRVHAVHVRHHARQVAETVAAPRSR
jgi:hypothetical protein